MALLKPSRLPDSFPVTLFDAMILYFNTMRAAQLGWNDADRSLSQFIKEAKRRAIDISRADLEAMIAACVQNSEVKEADYFWHPKGKKLKGFIQELMRHKATEQFYYDTYYNFFTNVSRDMKETGGLIISNKEEL